MWSQPKNEQEDKVEKERGAAVPAPSTTTAVLVVVPPPESHGTTPDIIEMILFGTTGESSSSSVEEEERNEEIILFTKADHSVTATTTRDYSSSASYSSSSRSSSSIESGDSLGKGKTTGDTHSTAAAAAEEGGGDWSSKWTRFVGRARRPIIQFLQALTRMAARHPKQTILAVSVLSFVLLAVGLATNFNVAVDEATLWTPSGSKPAQHSYWIREESNFPPLPRSFVLYFHSQGDNVLGKDQARRVFEALKLLRSLEDYNTVCAESDRSSNDSMGFLDNDGEITTRTCEIYGIPRFWNNSVSIFEQEISSDEDAILAMSSLVFADGIPAAQDQVFGLSERDYTTGLLTSVKAYVVTIQFPPTVATEDFEAVAIEAMLELRAAWELEAAGNDFLRLEVMAQRSLSDEYV
jgi:hypothetical protein